MENGVHPERRRKAELAMAEGLTKPDEEPEAEE